MIVKDEEQLLGELLDWVRPYVAAMIVVDTGSTDATARLAFACGAKVLHATMDFGFAPARNVGVVEAKTSWCVMFDADEWPTSGLLDWMARFCRSYRRHRFDAVYFWRENSLDGELLEPPRDYERHVRLFRSHLRFEGTLHEQVFSESGKVLDAPRELLLLHHKTAERQARQNKFYAEVMEAHGLEVESG
jgi:glycosyltransferase involved in cell wall biosynthesis